MEHLLALLCHPLNHSSWVCQPLTILTIHFLVCMTQVPGKVSHGEEVELNILLKQDEMIPQGGSLCCRSALHSTDMVGTELAAELGGLTAAWIDDTPLRRQLVQADHYVPCTIHCHWNLEKDSKARTFPRDIAEEFVMTVSGQGKVHRGGGY
jgi:hypothetical protein